MDRRLLAALGISLGLLLGFNATAAERKAYKIVDEKGNVTYSQTPPPEAAKSVQKVDISPASAGRGGNTTSPELRQRNPGQADYMEQRNQAMQIEQQRRQAAEKQRVENLKAECNRNRGADCDNPETLRLIEAQQVPGGKYYQNPNRR
jgi:Domain of unknown function (DUF4124)